ncbi:MAG: PLP-dependent aminotransferase family protein, partial [Gammaproteobacteria bacterium]
WRTMPREALGEGQGAGWPGLRDCIARHLATSRGLRCDGSQVFITTSVRSGIGLVVRALQLTQTQGWVEDPGYFGFADALKACDVEPCMVPVDDAGLDVAAGVRDYSRAGLAIVTPNAHFPTGARMTAPRRAALMAWARTNGGWIFEDDFDSENHFDGPPAAPIAASAPDVTIYMNSFSRLLFPALRIAYMVLPEPLVGAVTQVRASMDGHSNVPNQIVLSDFITNGHLDDHLRRCRRAYKSRRDTLLGAIEMELHDFLRPVQTRGGLQIVANLAHINEDEAERVGRALDLQLTGMSRFLRTATRPPQAVLGFAGFRPADIVNGARRARAGFEALVGARRTSSI